MKTITLASIVIAATLSSTSFAAPQRFNVLSGDLQFRNVATVESNTEFETFTGRTSNVSGFFNFDQAKRTGGGRVSVDLASIDTGIPLRNDHMKSEGWLNTAKFPSATFEATTVKFIKADEYRATGKFTLKGVTKTITVPLRVRYRAESAATRNAGFSGNVLQVIANFNIKLKDYGVTIPGPAQGKVSETVRLSVSVYGTSK